MRHHTLTLLFVIAMGIGLFFFVPILGIAEHPEIWGKTFVLILNIISKVLGTAIVIAGVYFLVFYYPTDGSKS